MGTPLRRKPPALEMAEAELHKERLQALAEKRKRQTEIEDKRRQLEDLILQLQHLKSKAMRERWLLQGAPAGTQEEEEGRRRQAERDETQVKRLEDTIHRLEGEIGLLEREESQISAKEQVLREKLRETERSIEDLQKSLQNQDGDAVNYIHSRIPDLPELYSKTAAKASGDEQLPKKAVMYAVEVSVEKDKKTGGTKILSTSAVSPENVHQRGVKVYDDGHKMVYEVRPGGPGTLENGVHPWSSAEVDELMQRVSQPRVQGDGGRATAAPAPAAVDGGPAGPRVEQTVRKEAKLEMVRGQQGTGTGRGMGTGTGTAGQPRPGPRPGSGFEEEVTEVPEATSEKPVTMIFMGYHNVDDEEETKKLLGFDGTIKAEIVLIDEDDEKSLREKTVTDISTMDGNAADLVSGRPLSDTTELSSEGKDESLATAKELPPADSGVALAVPMAVESGPLAGVQSKTLPTALKPSSKLSEDDSELKRERALKSVSFLDSVSIIPGGKDTMDLEAPFSEAQSDSQNNCYSTAGQNGVKNRHESLDSDVAKEIRYLDEVLEANCCEPGADAPSNGSSFPEHKAINVDGTGPSVQISGMLTPHNDEVIIEGKKQTTFIENSDSNGGKPNGHSGMIDQQFTGQSGELSATTVKKEARFELRAFQEEKKPSKLFDGSPETEPARVKKVRPSEEIAELERERQELIRGQAVKKNPGIAAKWWNPPPEKTLEEELDPDQLESHKRYEERRQRKPETASMPQVQTVIPTMPPESGKKEDIVMEQIDFSAARKQFLQKEPGKQPGGPKRGVAPQLYSAKPFSRATEVTHVERPSGSVMVGDRSHNVGESLNEVTTVKTERIYCSPGDSITQEARDCMAENEMKEGGKACMGDGDFTCARAVMTILREEDPDLFPLQRSANSSCLPEEIDSGLDDLSIRSQDTTVLETLSNDFSMDNVSDSGASNEAMNAFLENSLGDFSFPPTPQATTPINGKMDGGPKSPSEHGVSFSSPTASLIEQQLEYHAGILVQNAIQQAIAEQHSDWQTHPVLEHDSPIPEKKTEDTKQPPPPSEEKAKFEPPQASSPVPEIHTVTPKITAPTPVVPAEPVHHPVTSRNQSPPPSEKQEFSYFSKYSEAAELRSTASVARAQEMEVSAGPFKLRSRKQRTLSMIEEEIRAAQEREEELKRQRQTQALQAASSHRQKTNSLPARLSLSGRTAPGKIEKIRPGPPVSPASEGPLPSPLSDAGSNDSAGSQRPKNFMQTLMEDYETHKVKRREKIEDNSVLEATRVTRRKSNMALRWEAGIYANQDEGEEEEEEEEEE
ncbi:PALM2-AKAP2 fusion protein isoform X2 [Anguilla rostrata]|uniref:PALM2-AKAP2 fusion protein isoform X2 n=1 Tax=Anguilla rostrata TaxID=7938 RepID=UPI0030D60B76